MHEPASRFPCRGLQQSVLFATWGGGSEQFCLPHGAEGHNSFVCHMGRRVTISCLFFCHMGRRVTTVVVVCHMGRRVRVVCHMGRRVRTVVSHMGRSMSCPAGSHSSQCFFSITEWGAALQCCEELFLQVCCRRAAAAVLQQQQPCCSSPAATACVGQKRAASCPAIQALADLADLADSVADCWRTLWRTWRTGWRTEHWFWRTVADSGGTWRTWRTWRTRLADLADSGGLSGGLGGLWRTGLADSGGLADLADLADFWRTVEPCAWPRLA